MSEKPAAPTTAEQPVPPPFNPDQELIGHAEGNHIEEWLYRRAAERMRRETAKEAGGDG